MIADDWFVLGAPWDSSGTGRGEQQAPAALRSAGLAALASQDVGDAATTITSTSRDPASGVRALPDIVRAARRLAGRLDTAMQELPNRRPLVVGGDCSILLGIVPALRRRGPLGLWFVDSHPDFLDGKASETGETADMELAILTGSGATALIELSPSAPMVPADQVVLLGYRSRNLDDDAANEVARLPPQLPKVAADALTTDPASVGQRAARWLGRVVERAWLHLDLDVLDPSVLSAVTYPQPGGRIGTSWRSRWNRSPSHRSL